MEVKPTQTVPTLEVCCGSMADALAAVEGGAHRIELCAALSLDGLTPSMGTLHELRRRFPLRTDGTTDLRIHVLIRPREGNFVYTDAELCVMEHDIAEAVREGASAIVCGALTFDGDIDLPAMRRLMVASGEVPVTFHRAFDHVRHPLQALEQLIGLGVRRVLTSGGEASAEAGIERLCQWVEQADGRITVMPGGGITRHNVRHILEETGASEVHGSCSALLPNGQRQTSATEVHAVLQEISRRFGRREPS